MIINVCYCAYDTGELVAPSCNYNWDHNVRPNSDKNQKLNVCYFKVQV